MRSIVISTLFVLAGGLFASKVMQEACPDVQCELFEQAGSWQMQDKQDKKITLEWFAVQLHNMSNYSRSLYDLYTPEVRTKVDALAPVYAESFEEEIGDFFALGQTKLPEGYKGQRIIVTAKEADGTVLGFAWFVISGFESLKLENEGISVPGFLACRAAYLAYLGVVPVAQGRGISSKLIFSIIMILPHIQKILLQTATSNKQARDVYEHLGFSLVKEVEVGSATYLWDEASLGSCCVAA